ncbi:MAG: hypothetical protein WAK17_04650 [Candidatus Nitrosopolaris sp.]|jgi:hypothetical protein
MTGCLSNNLSLSCLLDLPSDAVRKNILNVIQTSSIDEFARSVNLSPGEAWEVYRQIKDLIVDSEVIGFYSWYFRKIQ